MPRKTLTKNGPVWREQITTAPTPVDPPVTSGPAPASAPASASGAGSATTTAPGSVVEETAVEEVAPEAKIVWNPESIKDMFAEWMTKALADNTGRARALGSELTERTRDRAKEAERIEKRKEADPTRAPRKSDAVADRGNGIDPVVADQVKTYEKVSKAASSPPATVSKAA